MPLITPLQPGTISISTPATRAAQGDMWNDTQVSHTSNSTHINYAELYAAACTRIQASAGRRTPAPMGHYSNANMTASDPIVLEAVYVSYSQSEWEEFEQYNSHRDVVALKLVDGETTYKLTYEQLLRCVRKFAVLESEEDEDGGNEVDEEEEDNE